MIQNIASLNAKDEKDIIISKKFIFIDKNKKLILLGKMNLLFNYFIFLILLIKNQWIYGI